MISLLIVAVPSEGENKDYPYPKKSNGTHVCKRLEEDDDCDWITNDDFTKEFIDSKLILPLKYKIVCLSIYLFPNSIKTA